MLVLLQLHLQQEEINKRYKRQQQRKNINSTIKTKTRLFTRLGQHISSTPLRARQLMRRRLSQSVQNKAKNIKESNV